VFLEYELVPAIYQTEWYNEGNNPEVGQNCDTQQQQQLSLLQIPCPDGSTGSACNRTEQDAHLLYNNMMLGVPRIRQLRVRNDSCEVTSPNLI
jgi:hypothetical protein